MISKTFKFKYNGIDFNIELKNKINVFRGDSGTGKTFMFKTLNGYLKDCGIESIYIDYNLLSTITIDKIDLGSYDYIMFDNADLYMTNELMQKIREINAVTLISLHKTIGYTLSDDMDKCYCIYENNSMTVRR